MDRLTKRLEDGQAVMDCAACGVSWHKKREKDIPYCTTLFCRNRLKERLAAYEDSGIEPEDLKKAFNESAILKLAAQALGTTSDHLRDLIQEEKLDKVSQGSSQGWISVRDRLPWDDNFVLAVASGKPLPNVTFDRAVVIASYDRVEGWIIEEYPKWDTPKVTHWMPVPEPPEERTI